MTAGVYAIIHTETGMAYVGSSTNIELRWTSHRATFSGPSYEWVILEITGTTDDELEGAEQKWMDQYAGRLFNSRKTAKRPRPSVSGMEPAELTRRRTALNLSRSELADLVGVSTPTVWRWEEGKFKPSGLALRQLELTLRRLERRAGPPGQGGE